MVRSARDHCRRLLLRVTNSVNSVAERCGADVCGRLLHYPECCESHECVNLYCTNIVFLLEKAAGICSAETSEKFKMYTDSSGNIKLCNQRLDYENRGRALAHYCLYEHVMCFDRKTRKSTRAAGLTAYDPASENLPDSDPYKMRHRCKYYEYASGHPLHKTHEQVAREQEVIPSIPKPGPGGAFARLALILFKAWE